MFFILNLTFNGVMWGLFTKALTLATSTVRVSVINTSANFFITALLGLLIFGEELPGESYLRMWYGKAVDDFNAAILQAGSSGPQILASIENGFTSMSYFPRSPSFFLSQGVMNRSFAFLFNIWILIDISNLGFFSLNSMNSAQNDS